jgi:hypothetical protein
VGVNLAIGVREVDVEPAIVVEKVGTGVLWCVVDGQKVVGSGFFEAGGELADGAGLFLRVGVAAEHPEDVVEWLVPVAEPAAVGAGVFVGELVAPAFLVLAAPADPQRCDGHEQPSVTGGVEHAVEVTPVWLVGLEDVVGRVEGIMSRAIGHRPLFLADGLHLDGGEAAGLAVIKIFHRLVERELLRQVPRGIGVIEERRPCGINQVPAVGAGLQGKRRGCRAGARLDEHGQHRNDQRRARYEIHGGSFFAAFPPARRPE